MKREKNAKLVAFYLPQFHEVEENNIWWGQGFTEWTNVRKAQPLFKGHYQPRRPANSRYYDLLEKSTVEWQTSIALEFGIAGFCYYHYWFGGKLLLEKPAENFLRWKDIRHEFCFCWANHSWKKTWDGTQRILMAQEYGGKEEWLRHLNYLLPFFYDDRYMKIDGKPIFVVYDMNSIPARDERFDFYNAFLKEKGFGGIHLVETIKRGIPECICKLSSAVLLRQPDLGFASIPLIQRAMNKLNRTQLNRLTFFSYNAVWRSLLRTYNKAVAAGTPVMPCLFFDWDNTSRHSIRGTVVRGASPESFRRWMRVFMERNQSDIVFINAWNEWCEGMYLEPDELHGSGYLDVIKEWVNGIC